MLYGYSSTSGASKFLGGKSLSTYASVDQLFDAKNSSKPSLKLKSSKLGGKQNKNSSVDSIFQKNYLENELKYSNKNFPSNLKIKKDKSKTKKKNKFDVDYLSKQIGGNYDGRNASQGPLSINIVNNNHLHLSGYNASSKSNGSNTISSDSNKKENFQNIIKNFKPNQIGAKNQPSVNNEEHKTKTLKQEIKTTRPKKSAKKTPSKFLTL